MKEKKLNSKMLVRPNIYYIFEKLAMSNMTFPYVNPIQLCPTKQKRALYVIISGKIPEN